MNPWELLKAAHAVGFANLFYALSYGRTKKRLDAPFAARRREWDRTSPVAAGALLNHAIDNSHTVRLSFEHAELEICALDEDLLRLTYTPGRLPAPYTLAGAAWPHAALAVAPDSAGLTLSTPALRLEMARDGGWGLFEIKQKTPLCRFDAPGRQGERWIMSGPLQDNESIMGLGQSNGPLNLRGRTRILWNTEAKGNYGPGKDPIYLSVPVYYAQHAGGGYLAFFENSFFSTFSFAKDRAKISFDGGALRLYLTPGPLPRALERYTRLTGRPAMPPRWALGYQQARWSYMDEAEVKEVLDGFEKHEMPLSALHLDIHYMDGYRVFTVDEQRFPDLKKLSGEMEKRGVKLVTILDPGVKKDEDYPIYREMKARDLFCKLPDGSLLHAPVWPGWTAFPDFTKPETRAYWSEQYRFLTERGVAGVWHDMNEPAAFTATGYPTLPDALRHDLDGLGGDHREGHNLYALLENRAAYEALAQLRPDRRPWLLSRSGWAGLQRYAWNWTGDTGDNWWSLGQNIRLLLMLGISGIPYTGSDIGGFNGDPSAELYIRWFQAFAFAPFFRTHSAAFVKRREPWSFGEPYTGIAREFIKLRYRFMPYWYTLAWQASQSGWPLARPVWWNDPADESLWNVENQFLLGDAVLVAPIVEKGATHREVAFPKGQWLSFWDDSVVEGPARVGVDAPLERLPLFVRAGSVLPLEENGKLVLHLYLTAQVESVSGLVYSDAGDGYGASRLDYIDAKRVADGWEIRRRQEGEGPFSYAGIELCVHGVAVTGALLDGRNVALKNNRLEVGQFDVCRLLA
ncbi:MAG: alpha-glucosidase [Myxococcales bacterium]|nr:MAG: alpha-glucosidase [Myxococcales bacterium]